MQERKPEDMGPASKEASLGRCLIDADAATDSSGRRMRRGALGMSFTIEAAIVALLVVSPLLTSVAQPQLHMFSPRPILAVWHAHQTNQQVLPKASRSLPSITNPLPQSVLPGPLVKIHDDAERNDVEIPDSPGENVPGAIQITDLGVTPPKVEPPHANSLNTHAAQTMKVSEGIQQAQLISRVEPPYPVLARQTRTEGIVRLRAMISREGRITALEVLSGPPLLVQAALDAVRQWRYRPTLLDGEPVEVETSITVIFRLGP